MLGGLVFVGVSGLGGCLVRGRIPPPRKELRKEPPPPQEGPQDGDPHVNRQIDACETLPSPILRMRSVKIVNCVLSYVVESTSDI